MVRQPSLFVRTLFRAAAVLAVLALGACTEVPELEALETRALRDAPYPALIPLDPSLFSEPAPEDEADELEEGLSARMDRLQGRARRLNAPVIDEPTRKRMKAGVAGPG